MKHYEVLFILKPTLTEDEIKERVDFVKEIITKNGGEVVSVIEMGARKLAYEIKKYQRGVYFVIYFTAPTSLIEELVRNIRYNEDIIRFLTVKYESKKEISAWEKLSKGIKFSSTKTQRKPRKPRTQENTQENVKQDQQEEEKTQE